MELKTDLNIKRMGKKILKEMREEYPNAVHLIKDNSRNLYIVRNVQPDGIPAQFKAEDLEIFLPAIIRMGHKVCFFED